MKNSIRILSIILCFIMLVPSLWACNKKTDDETTFHGEWVCYREDVTLKALIQFSENGSYKYFFYDSDNSAQYDSKESGTWEVDESYDGIGTLIIVTVEGSVYKDYYLFVDGIIQSDYGYVYKKVID